VGSFEPLPVWGRTRHGLVKKNQICRRRERGGTTVVPAWVAGALFAIILGVLSVGDLLWTARVLPRRLIADGKALGADEHVTIIFGRCLLKEKKAKS
jgi:hypothetical protein